MEFIQPCRAVFEWTPHGLQLWAIALCPSTQLPPPWFGTSCDSQPRGLEFSSTLPFCTAFSQLQLGRRIPPQHTWKRAWKHWLAGAPRTKIGLIVGTW